MFCPLIFVKKCKFCIEVVIIHEIFPIFAENKFFMIHFTLMRFVIYNDRPGKGLSNWAVVFALLKALIYRGLKPKFDVELVHVIEIFVNRDDLAATNKINFIHQDRVKPFHSLLIISDCFNQGTITIYQD